MQDSDLKLEALLRATPIEAPASNLAERIIAATRIAPAARRNTSMWDAFFELLMPKSAFALALALVMGVVVGVQAASTDIPNDTGDENFLSYEGDVL